MSICKPALGYAISKFVMPWRANYGIIMSILGNKLKKDKSALAEMKTNLSDAEEILSHRKIQNVQDLNLGDLAIFLKQRYHFLSFRKSIMKIIQPLIIFTKLFNKFQNFRKLMKNFMNFFYHLKRMKGLLLFLLILRKYGQPSN